MRSIGDRRKETAGAYQPYHVRADPRASRLDRGEILDWSFRTRVTHCVSLFLPRGTPERGAPGGGGFRICGDALHVRNASLKYVWQLTYVAMYA
jgi:hypothetical protein